jgi:predicted transporter
MSDAANNTNQNRYSWIKKAWPFLKPAIFILVCIIGLYIGLVIGYVGIGKQPTSEITELSTWQHIIDLIFG